MPPWSILAQVKETGTTIVWLRCRPIFHKRSTSWTRDHVLEIIFLHHEHHDHDHHLDHHHDDYHHDHYHQHQHHHHQQHQHQHQHHHHHHHHNRHHHLFVIVPLPPQTWLLIASRSRNRCQFKIVPMHSNTFQLTIWPTMMHLVSGTCLQKTNADQSHPLTLRSDDYIVDSDLRNNNLRIDQISNLQVFFHDYCLPRPMGNEYSWRSAPNSSFLLLVATCLGRVSLQPCAATFARSRVCCTTLARMHPAGLRERVSGHVQCCQGKAFWVCEGCGYRHCVFPGSFWWKTLHSMKKLQLYINMSVAATFTRLNV